MAHTGRAAQKGLEVVLVWREAPDLSSALVWINVPHRVKQSAVVLQPQQLVGRGHVMSNRLLAVKEEGVGRPDVAGQQVVQRQHLHGAFEAQALILPALAEEDVYGVFLRREQEEDVRGFCCKRPDTWFLICLLCDRYISKDAEGMPKAKKEKRNPCVDGVGKGAKSRRTLCGLFTLNQDFKVR